MAKANNTTSDNVRYLVKLLLKPNLDPRDDLPTPVLRKDVMSMEDLKKGMVLKAIVRNVVDFGAFVDIGVKVNGLVHKSEIANQYVQNPHDFVAVGDVRDVEVLSVDLNRKRIQLSMKQVEKKKKRK